MSRIQNLLGLLKILLASDGELETRIRVQKEAFLIGLKFPEIFNIREFEYHHYGPYSRSLSEALQFAVASGLVDEIDESPADRSFTKYKYCLTDTGPEALLQVGGVSDEFSKFTKFLNQFDWRALELASTVLFLQNTDDLAEQEAFEKSLRLKPLTLSKKEDAKLILEKLN